MTFCIREARSETAKIRRVLETAEMKIVRRIAGKILTARERSEDIRNMCRIYNNYDWVLNRKIKCNKHIDRMAEL